MSPGLAEKNDVWPLVCGGRNISTTGRVFVSLPQRMKLPFFLAFALLRGFLCNAETGPTGVDRIWTAPARRKTCPPSSAKPKA